MEASGELPKTTESEGACTRDKLEPAVPATGPIAAVKTRRRPDRQRCLCITHRPRVYFFIVCPDSRDELQIAPPAGRRLQAAVLTAKMDERLPFPVVGLHRFSDEDIVVAGADNLISFTLDCPEHIRE